jgi:hypothetical protein
VLSNANPNLPKSMYLRSGLMNNTKWDRCCVGMSQTMPPNKSSCSKILPCHLLVVTFLAPCRMSEQKLEISYFNRSNHKGDISLGSSSRALQFHVREMILVIRLWLGMKVLYCYGRTRPKNFSYSIAQPKATMKPVVRLNRLIL